MTRSEVEKIAGLINESLDVSDIEYLVSLLKRQRLDEIRKALPYGTYASSSNKCPYCGK